MSPKGKADVPDVLRRIVAQRATRIGRLDPVPSEDSPLLDGANPFLRACSERRGSALIAEVKLGTPRLGRIDHRFSPEEQARLYRQHGAAALSVVTEPDFFFGSYELLARCREASGLPAIAKDFLVSTRQLKFAQEAGASAVLLIATLYTGDELRAWADLARSHGLAPLIETHSRADVQKLEGSEWELVGVNARNLRTFEVDLDHAVRALPDLPAGSVKVAESGIRSGDDKDRLSSAGFDAFLVGESLLLADDPAAKVRELAGSRS